MATARHAGHLRHRPRSVLVGEQAAVPVQDGAGEVCVVIAATPPAFRDLLISIAESARKTEAA